MSRDYHFSDRREFMKNAALLGSAYPFLSFGADSKKSTKEPKAKSIIHIFLPGGMAAQESFDPKPFNPYEYRGPFGSIKTNVPGVHFSENMKHTAKVMDKITVIRSMTHGEAAHERGTHNMFTGYRPSPAIKYPSMGSIVAHQLGTRDDMPPYICIPNQPNEFAGTGFLSSSYSPFSLGSDPANGGFKVRDLMVKGIKEDRQERRKQILEMVDGDFKGKNKADIVKAMDSFYSKAFNLMNSPKAQEAFDLNKENAKMRDTYGRNQAGQRFLMARRLVEAGSRYVTVTAGGWDHHDRIRDNIKRHLIPLDQAYAALINDLDQRGMLDSTLVLLTTEFGRTPKINKTAGRDHYPKVFSISMAGGGVSKGLVYGMSDATSVAPEEDPVYVSDLARTVHHLIGIDAETRIMSPGDRPVAIVDGGNILTDILA